MELSRELTSQLEKARKDLEKALSDRGALYAVVGAGDLAVAKLRQARDELNARAARLDPKTLGNQAAERFLTSIEAIQSDVQDAPEQVKALPTKAQEVLGEAVATAVSAYGELAGRGKDLLTRVRTQQATVDLQQQAKSTVTRARSTRTSVKKTAARTKTSAKATATSARKTATAAKRAAEAGGSKVGD